MVLEYNEREDKTMSTLQGKNCCLIIRNLVVSFNLKQDSY